MRLIIRFVLPLVLILIALSYALTPVIRHLTEGWFRRDLELRSELVFNSLQDNVADAIQSGNKTRIEALFKRVTKDERLVAIAFCSDSGDVRYRSDLLPANFKCDPDYSNEKPHFAILGASGGPVLVGNFILPLNSAASGKIVIFHDMNYMKERGRDIRQLLFLFLIALGLLSSLATAFVARLTLKGWVESVLSSFEGKDQKRLGFGRKDFLPLLQDIRQRLRLLDMHSRAPDDIRVQWTANTLKKIMENELPEAEIIVISNREPYIHNMVDGQIKLQIPASGLVTALEPIVRAAGGKWIAHGSGSGDKQAVDKNDHVMVPPDKPSYTLRRIWLSEEEEKGYYYGFANEGFWPLCHITFTRPVFRESDWQEYKKVNRKFAEAAVKECKTKNPIILVQDYHLALAPRMIHEMLPDALVILFWHIPWPNAETFSICPWKNEILDGMLGSDIVGFHTQLHCNNFLETVDRFLESRIDREHSSVSHRNKLSWVRPYPVSIEWPPAAMENIPSVADCRKAVFEKYNLPVNLKLGVGVERFDYTKGILDRFEAVDSFLSRHPEWIEKFTFLQIAAPSRSALPQYRNLQQATTERAEEINAKYSRNGWHPILLVAEHHEPKDVYTIFRASDLCIVSSLHDGMNLVAKEFIAARDDERGALILSTFAGASRELLEALIVNPYDASAMGEAIHTALSMSVDEQKDRTHLMRDMLQDNNVYRWAGQIILDAARIRKRDLLNKQLAILGNLPKDEDK
jgi:trehalose 6-phosphate synthase